MEMIVFVFSLALMCITLRVLVYALENSNLSTPMKYIVVGTLSLLLGLLENMLFEALCTS